MNVFFDQMERKVQLKPSPQRIVSLVPSITEFLFALGLEDRVVGITKFCIFPDEWFRTKTKIGGTKSPDIQKIKTLQPDLIIGNKEENREEDIAEMSKFSPVWMSDVNSVSDMYEMLQALGEVLGCSTNVKPWLTKWEAFFQENKTRGQGRSALYVIWKDPIMVVGKNTYIDSYMTEIGYNNCVNEDRYPMLKDLEGIEPEEILLSSEPFPFKEEDFVKFKSLFPKANIQLVSGEEFSWYGVRNLVDEKQ